MKLTTFVAALAGGCLATSAMAQSDALAQIAELRAQLAAVQAQAGNNTLTEERANEIKSIVRDTLADADTRTSLQGGGAMAGYDNGFFVSSADGNFKLRLGVLEQVRFVWQFDDADTMGFENRRTQLAFGGNMFDPSWTYKVVFNYSAVSEDNIGGVSRTPYGEEDGFDLADASITKTLDGGLAITAGQYRTPFTRATLVGDGVQLAADYSVNDYFFSGGYMQGIMASWSSDMWRAMASVGNQIGSVNGTWNQPVSNAQDFNGALRVEAKLNGSWNQFNKETSFRGEEFGLLLGAAYLHSDTNDVVDILTEAGFDARNAVTVDATAMFGGANVSFAYTYGNLTDIEGTDTNTWFWGFTLQGGVFVTDKVEIWGAWNYFDQDESVTNAYNEAASIVSESAIDGNGSSNFVQFGANVYFAKNGCKWTTQVNLPLSDNSVTANFFGSTGSWGWTPNGDGGFTSGSDASILTQLQFMF